MDNASRKFGGKMGERFFEDSNALDSLRSSDFDAYSAYGEVIDNSIQANATEIKLNFKVSATGNHRKIDSLAFGDNGSGMDARIIASCLKLGWSSRFNDRSGIGRFGVGMVLGAIHECKRIEVFSKQGNADGWLWTYVDLDEVADKTLSEIPVPIKKTIPKEYRSLVGSDSGTLVIWSKYDRQKYSSDKIIRETHSYIGRTFRHFIWDTVNIEIDGEAVKAYDPLFLTTEKTAFPNDPSGTEFEPFTIDWPIKDRSSHEEFGEKSKITIRMSILPEEFRPTAGSGGSKIAKERKIDTADQEGLSILREGREVFSGNIARWNNVKFGSAKSSTWRFEEIDRWWGCEINFGAELDASFEVKNIKRGARPEEELLAAIKEKITPTRDSVLEQVRDVWKKEREARQDEEAQKSGELKRHKGHGTAEKAAANAISTRSRFNAEKSVEETSSAHFDEHGSHLEKTQAQRYKELFESQPYTIIDDDKGWRGGTFWEVTTGGNKIIMQYNLQHEFMSQLRNLEQVIAAETDNVKLREHSTKITALVDLLLISFAKAQSQFNKEDKVEVEEFLEMLNTNWGQTLKSFIKSWIETESNKDE